jgi:hypothetical protein
MTLQNTLWRIILIGLMALTTLRTVSATKPTCTPILKSAIDSGKVTIKTGVHCFYKDGGYGLSPFTILICEKTMRKLEVTGQKVVCSLKDAKWNAVVVNYYGIKILYSEKALAEVNRDYSEWYRHAGDVCGGFSIALRYMPLSKSNIMNLNILANNCYNEKKIKDEYPSTFDIIVKKVASIVPGKDHLTFLNDVLSSIPNLKEKPQDADLLVLYAIVRTLQPLLNDHKIPETTLNPPELARGDKGKQGTHTLQFVSAAYSGDVSSDWYIKIFSCFNNQERLTTSPGPIRELWKKSEKFQYSFFKFDEEVWFELWERNKIFSDRKVGRGSTCRKIVDNDTCKLWPGSDPLTLTYRYN